jgi:hypothetical protein
MTMTTRIADSTPSYRPQAALVAQIPAAAAPTKPRALDANPALNFAPKRVYFTRTGNFVIGGKQLPIEQFRQNTRVALASMRPTDTISVEGLSAYGPESKMLKTVVEEYSRLPAGQRPKIELFASGISPLLNSPLHNAAKKIPGGVLLRGGEVGGKPTAVLNLGSGAVVDLIAKQLIQLKDIGKVHGVDLPVLVDDHFSAPKFREEDFAKANGIQIKGGQVNHNAVRSRLASSLHTLADKVGGIRLSVHGTPESAARQFNMDSALLVKKGKVDDLEFQLYKYDAPAFAKSVNEVVSYLSANPKVANNLSSLKIGISSFVGMKIFGEPEITQQAQVIEQAKKELKKIYPNLDVSISLFPYQGFYKPK